MIGRYVLGDKIGAGGMGWVFAAHDPELDREVAIKIVRPTRHGASEGERARLLREAQALAQLTHPNVVRIFDAGTAGNRVYLAMELLSGDSLREWLQSEPPRPWPDVVEVFLHAARGLAAAHAAGIVHRDFKPANVTVGADGAVRVIDFGLAHAAPHRPSSFDTRDPIASGDLEASRDTGTNRLHDHLTEAGFVMGTPAYMAPEQHQGLETDARCDQFALCVALYHALYGVYPYVSDEPGGLLRLKLQERRQAPTRGQEVPRVIRRAIERGLRADPAERWPSMLDLVAALQRGLTGRRWGGWLVAAGVIGAGAAFVGWPRASASTTCDARQRLEGIWDDEARTDLRDALTGASAGFAQGTWSRVETEIDRFSREWQAEYTKACEERAEPDALPETVTLCLARQRDQLQVTLEVLRDAEADALPRAVAMAHALPSPSACAPDDAVGRAESWPQEAGARETVAAARRQLARAMALEDAGRYDAALVEAKAALAIAEPLQFAPLTVEAKYQVGSLLAFLGDLEAAVPMMTEAAYDAQSIDHTPVILNASIRLAFIVGRRLNRFDEGIRWARFGLAYLDRIGEAGSRRASLLNSLGTVLEKKGEGAEAERLHREAIALWEAEPEAHDMELATGHNNLGLALYGQGRYDEAIEQYQLVVALREKALGPLHPDTGVAHNNLANAFAELRRLDEAQEHQSTAFSIWSAGLGPEHPYVAASLHNLGMLAYRRNDLETAEAKYVAAIELRERILGADDPDLASTYLNLGAVYSSRDRHDDAGKLFAKAARILTAAMGPEHAHVLMARANMAETLRLQGHLEEAIAEQRDILAIRERTLRADHPEVAKASMGLGYMLVDVKRYPEAEAAVTRALEIYERGAADPMEVARARFMLAQAVVTRDRPRAMALAREASAQMAAFEEAAAEREEIETWLKDPAGEGE
jgi:tetratricopeptide (TPR) repeat protein